MAVPPSSTDNKTYAQSSHWVDRVHGTYIAWLVLFTSLVLTVIAWQLSSDSAERRATDRFRFAVADAQSSIRKRMIEYEQMLHSGVGFFRANEFVSREQWRIYVENLHLSTYFPGVQGVGYSEWITPEQKQAHIERIRAEGFPDYTIRPEGERDVYTSIIYLEPFDWRNKRAFGYDMFSQEMRQAAMIRAIETGKASVSGRVTLVQETTTDVQYGFLMYVPLFHDDAKSPQARRDAIKGFVYSAFRMGDLMRGILGDQPPELEFEIFDGDNVSADTILYDSDKKLSALANSNAETYSLKEVLKFGGRTWTVFYNSNDQFAAAIATNQPLVVGIAGVVIDVALFFVILTLSKLRNRAVTLAGQMVKEMGVKDLQFKSIADTAHEAITTVDSEGILSYANAAAHRMFGFQKETLVGVSMTTLIPEFAISLLEENEHAEGQGSDDKLIQLLGRRRDGSEFPLELSSAFWTVGDTLYVTVISRDITERKKVDKLKHEFISTVSHELRTPLTSIGGSLRLVQSGMVGNLTDKGKELIDIANRNLDRLGRLINDILDVDKIEAGTIQMSLKPQNVQRLVEQAVVSSRTSADEKNVSIAITEVVSEWARVDEDRFIQVMSNLLSNAVKFSPPDAVVKVAVTRRENSVRVAISDQGRGIPDEFRSRIFQKFAQADASDTKEKGGTGLGLNIVRSLVEQFGGTVGYDSEWERGSTFYFDLPVCAPGTADAKAARAVV